MAPKKTYLDFCGDLSNDPFGTVEERVEFATLTAAHYDTTTPSSKNEDQLLVEVMIDMGPATGMNGGLIVFVEETGKLGGTLQVLHKIAVTPRDDHQNVVFTYYNDVKDGDVETIPFQKAVLAETDEVIVPDMMTRLLQHFTTAENLDHMGPYAEGDPFTKMITTGNAMFLPFTLISQVMEQNLTPKSAIRILVLVIITLGLKLPQLTNFLLAACTKTADNNLPVTVQDNSEVGVEHNLQRIFKFSSSRKKHILYKQIPSFQLGVSDLGHAVFMQNIAAFTEGMRVAFVNNTNQCWIDAETRNRPTTVGEQDPDHLDCILKLCNVETEEDLPII